MSMQDSIENLEKEIGHIFSDRALLKDALTHSSFGGASNYERLEFLGDRVIGLIVAEILYDKFPDEPEGHLAKRLAALVQGSFLAIVAKEINLGRYIEFSDAEASAGGAENLNILADVFESLIGALYLDSDFKTCRTLVERLWGERFFEMDKPPMHPKTVLQEWAQGSGLSLPEYEIASQEGPDHAPEFEIKLSVQGHPDTLAKGRTRQEAEKQAAINFLTKLGVI